MVALSDAVGYAQAKNYSGSGAWLDESSASARDATISGALFYDVDYNVGHYTRHPGTSTELCKTPDATAWDICDDGVIDIRIMFSIDDVTPAAISYLISKNPSGGTTGWGVYLTTGGVPTFEIGDGTNRTISASTAPTWSNGDVYRLGLTYNPATGLANFFFNTDFDVADITTWTQLGSADRDIGSTYSATNNNDDVEIGSSAGGERLTGNIYRLQVRDGTNGTLIGNFDATEVDDADRLAGTHTDSAATPKVWTHTRSGAEFIRWVDRPHFWFDGTNDGMEISDHADLDFAGGVDFTIGIGKRAYVVATGTLLYKGPNTSPGPTWSMWEQGGTPDYVRSYSVDGVASNNDGSYRESKVGEAVGIVSTNDRGTLHEMFTNGDGGSGGTGPPASALTLANSNSLWIGRTEAADTYYKGEIWAWSVHRSLLNNTDADAVSVELQAVPPVNATTTPSVIVTTTALGTVTVLSDLAVSPSVIVTTVALGTALPVIVATPSVIATTVAMGTTTILSDVSASPSVIVTTTAVGTVTASLITNVSPSVIATTTTMETVTAFADLILTPTAIVTTVAFGTVTAGEFVNVTPSVIATTTVLGTVTTLLTTTISPTVIITTTALGTVTSFADITITPSVIATTIGMEFHTASNYIPIYSDWDVESHYFLDFDVEQEGG